MPSIYDGTIDFGVVLSLQVPTNLYIKDKAKKKDKAMYFKELDNKTKP